MNENMEKIMEAMKTAIVFSKENKYIKDEILRGTENRVNKIKLIKLLTGNMPLEMFNEEELYWIIKSYYKGINNLRKEKKIEESIRNTFNPENFYTNIAITEYETKIPKIKKVNKQVLTLDKMRPSNPYDKLCDEFFGCVDYKTIAESINSGLLTYETKTQREAKVQKVRGYELELPNINSNSVSEISDSMNPDKQGKYERNMITLNIFASGYEDYSYDEKKEKLVVNISDQSPVHIIDGGHRCAGIVDVISKNPDLQDTIFVKVVHYGVANAISVIKQEQKMNQMSKKYIETLGVDNAGMIITRKVNTEQPTNDMNLMLNKITNLEDRINIHTAYVHESLFAEEILHHFKDLDLSSMLIQKQLKDYLINFFNYTLSLFKEDFSDISKSQKTSVLTRQNMFIGYLTIAKALYKEENWEDKLIEGLSDVDFTKNNSIWEELKINSNLNLNTRQKNKIREYFGNLIEQSMIEEGVVND